MQASIQLLTFPPSRSFLRTFPLEYRGTHSKHFIDAQICKCKYQLTKYLFLNYIIIE